MRPEHAPSSVRIVLHPEGLLDLPGLGYWTEVVEMPRCMAEGPNDDSVLELTRLNIRAEVLADGATTRDAVNIIVERAM